MKNWLTMSDKEIMDIASPIMDNLMQASTDIDYEKHIKDFSADLKKVLPKDNFNNQCKEYQKTFGFFSKRELVGIFRKKSDVRIFWRQWYTKSRDEYLAFLHLIEQNGEIEIMRVSVS